MASRAGVLIADHDGVRRLGLRTVIGREGDLEVVAEAESADEAIGCFRTHRPDVMLLDLGLPETGGLGVIEALRPLRRQRDARILVSMARESDEAVYRTLRAGAWASIRRDAPPAAVVEAIRRARAGQTCLEPALVARLAAKARQDAVTAGEIGVLELVASGLSNHQIARRLEIRESSVKARLASARAKLGARDRAHAVTLAFAHGLIDLDDFDAASRELRRT